jgi:2,3-bisphosphoglycerate-independent phosphoglycerate mutase
MKEIDTIQQLIEPNTTRIVLLVLDGLGGLPREAGGGTELETARTPNLDALAAISSVGLTQPALPGMTVGSGPGHLALFGYDPIEYEIGRGALEALGVDFDLRINDVAARGNFCTLNSNGILTDRRAGRLPDEQSQELIHLLRTIQIDGVEFFIEQVKEHRFAWIMRGEGLSPELSGTDPLKIGETPLSVTAESESAQKAARLANEFLRRANQLLESHSPANAIMLRGFASLPHVPQYPQIFGLHPAAIAINGMYKGVARLVGMDILQVDGSTITDEITTLEQNWNNYDFFYLHVKKTDTCGEAGDFDGKVKVIEEIDRLIPRIMALKPDVFIVTGDHSSPAVMKSHSWHPVPTLLYSPLARPDRINQFGERACQQGSVGIIPAHQLMPLALAHAGRISKYGA